MGCDIHTYVERQNSEGVWDLADWPGHDNGPFRDRDYYTFGCLGGVRHHVTEPIAASRRLPSDVSDEVRVLMDDGDHHASWVGVDELAAFDYDAVVPGKSFTFRKLLSWWTNLFFTDLEVLMGMNVKCPTRVVFWFDN